MTIRSAVLSIFILFVAASGYGQRASLKGETIRIVSGREIETKLLDQFLANEMEGADLPGLSIAIINDAEIVERRGSAT